MGVVAFRVPMPPCRGHRRSLNCMKLIWKTIICYFTNTLFASFSSSCHLSTFFLLVMLLFQIEINMLSKERIIRIAASMWHVKKRHMLPITSRGICRVLFVFFVVFFKKRYKIFHSVFFVPHSVTSVPLKVAAFQYLFIPLLLQEMLQQSPQAMTAWYLLGTHIRHLSESTDKYLCY